MCWEQWRNEKCVKGHSVDLSFRMSSTFDHKHCMEWKHTLPLVSPKSTSSSMSQRGPGDTQPWTILEAMTSASGRGSYCGNMNAFSIGESSREGQKDLDAEPTPLFFLDPSGNESLAKYVRNPPYWLRVPLVCESYVSPIHTPTHTERGTWGSRNQAAHDRHGVLSLQARLSDVSFSLLFPPVKWGWYNLPMF